MRKPMLALLFAALCTTQVQAQSNVFFEGNVSNFCALSLPTNGNLVTGTDGYLTSLVPGSITVFNTGGNFLHLDRPVWDAGGTPGGYTQGGETFEYGYLGLAGLGLANSGWLTAASTSVALPALPLAVLTLNARVKSPTAFATGTYRLKLVVTCAAT